MLSLAACTDKEDSGESGVPTPSGSAQTESGSRLPAGAASEYELVAATIDYLNSGFDPSKVSDVFDPTLTAAVVCKMQFEDETSLTKGMDWKETYDLLAELHSRAQGIEIPLDEDNEPDFDEVDIDQFRSAFPADKQSVIDSDYDEYEDFIEDYALYSDEFELHKGYNPYGTDQTVWAAPDEGTFASIEFDNYDDFDSDLRDAFPNLREYADMDKYQEGSTIYYMSILYTEIDGRYYLIGFPETIGSAGG